MLDHAAQTGQVERDVVTRRRIADADARASAVDHDRLAPRVRLGDDDDDVLDARRPLHPRGRDAVDGERR